MVRSKRLSRLVDAVEERFPQIDDPVRAIAEGKIAVDGRPLKNPSSVIGPGSAVTLVGEVRLRGEAKLEAALDLFGIDVAGKTALDAGASTGGFTRVLLRRGASRVYAVDAGHGQLLGSLRQDERVLNLEATNIGELDRTRVPDAIRIVTLDLSYISLADAVPQLSGLEFGAECELMALVKPMFELHLPRPPEDEVSFQEALQLAVAGIERAGWTVPATAPSPVRGARGAFELFIHARRVG